MQGVWREAVPLRPHTLPAPCPLPLAFRGESGNICGGGVVAWGSGPVLLRPSLSERLNWGGRSSSYWDLGLPHLEAASGLSGRDRKRNFTFVELGHNVSSGPRKFHFYQVSTPLTRKLSDTGQRGVILACLLCTQPTLPLVNATYALKEHAKLQSYPSGTLPNSREHLYFTPGFLSPL